METIDKQRIGNNRVVVGRMLRIVRNVRNESGPSRPWWLGWTIAKLERQIFLTCYKFNYIRNWIFSLLYWPVSEKYYHIFLPEEMHLCESSQSFQ